MAAVFFPCFCAVCQMGSPSHLDERRVARSLRPAASSTHAPQREREAREVPKSPEVFISARHFGSREFIRKVSLPIVNELDTMPCHAGYSPVAMLRATRRGAGQLAACAW